MANKFCTTSSLNVELMETNSKYWNYRICILRARDLHSYLETAFSVRFLKSVLLIEHWLNLQRAFLSNFKSAIIIATFTFQHSKYIIKRKTYYSLQKKVDTHQTRHETKGTVATRTKHRRTKTVFSLNQFVSLSENTLFGKMVLSYIA
jgi:hypothetical protein